MTSKAVIHILGHNNKIIEARLNAQCDFKATVPAPGKYTVSAILPNWVSLKASELVEVPERGCAVVPLRLRPDGQVGGRAIAVDGAPARGVLLKLVSVGDFPTTEEVRTDQQGRSQFRGVMPDTYQLGVNPNSMDDPSPEVPYASTWYAEARGSKQPFTIQVGWFEKVRLKSFQLPTQLKPRTIRVKVALEDGRPLPGASISCTPEGHSYWRKDLTDRNGEISFPAMDRISYIVDVSIDATLDVAKQGYQRSQWVRVPPGNGTTNVDLVFKKP